MAGPEATKPKTSRLCPALICPFQPTSEALTVAPDCDQSVFHADWIRCPAVQSQVRSQPSRAFSPAVTVTVPCQPEPQSPATSIVAEHSPAGGSSSPAPPPSASAVE